MILVTGGAGYIGSHAVKFLLENGYEVAVLDNLSRGYREVVDVLKKEYGKDKLRFYEADLRCGEKVEEIFGELKLSGVLHFAALCSVNESMEQPELYFENNVVGTLNLLKAIKKYKVKRLVFSSTYAVYGESQYLPIDEEHPTNPTNPYGESKLISEKMIRWFGELYGLKYSIFRYFNVAGSASDGLIGDSKKPSQLLMQNAVRGALGIEQFKLTCPKVNTPDGTPIRDYINVEDLVEAHVMVLKYLKTGGSNEVFNLGTGKGNSVLEIVNKIKEVTRFDFQIESGVTRKGEYGEIYANISKSKKILKWEPKRLINDNIESLVKWYGLHPSGWSY